MKKQNLDFEVTREMKYNEILQNMQLKITWKNRPVLLISLI